MTSPTNRDARERLAAALDLLPDVKTRLASGQQPNAYESGGGFIVGIGPVTNCLALVETGTEEVADMFEQALRVALLSDQPLPTVATGHPEQGALLSGWLDLKSAPSNLPVLVQFRAFNDPKRELMEQVAWHYDGAWRPYPLVNDVAYADRWKPLPADGAAIASTTDASQASGTPNNPSTQTKGGE